MPEIVPTASTSTPNAVVVPVVVPGSETTEYKIHKYVMIVGGVFTAALGICSQLQMFAPTGSKVGGYLTLAATVLGAGLLILKDLGYSDDRKDVKVAAAQAAGNIAAAQVAAQAGQNAGTAAEALK